MIKLNNGAICDHEVGAGKTLIMCTAAQEMKRLGLAHKPMIIGLKANIPALPKTTAPLIHTQNILSGQRRFYAQKRQRIFGILKTTIGIVLFSHDQFGMIPAISRNTKGNLRNRIDSVERNLDALKSQGKEVTRGMLAG